MIFYANVCPPTLLSELKSKLNEGPLFRSVLPGNSSANKFSPLLLLKHTGFEKSLHDVLFEKSAFSPSPGQLESICELLPKLGTAVDKMVPGIWNKVFSELIMHGFPCMSKAVDVIDTIMKDPSRASVLKKFMSDGDGEQMEDACSSQHGDLLVLINALDNCISESMSGYHLPAE
nr:auxin transport protein BIG [Tanacetum cinerariifolium]